MMCESTHLVPVILIFGTVYQQVMLLMVILLRHLNHVKIRVRQS